MHLSKEELQEMRQMDIRDVRLDTLVDIRSIEAGNPFFVRVGEYVVKTGYSNCAETLNDRMKQYIKKVAEIKY